LFIIARRAILI